MMATFLLFSSISNFVDVFMGVSASLTYFISNLFNRSLMYLLWLMNMPSLVCLIWNQKKKVWFSHHAHFKFILHALCKFLIKRFINNTKYNIINIYLYNNIYLPFLFVKRVMLILSILKSFSMRKVFNLSY